jgi:hypothetical protein
LGINSGLMHKTRMDLRVGSSRRASDFQMESLWVPMEFEV